MQQECIYIFAVVFDLIPVVLNTFSKLGDWENDFYLTMIPAVFIVE